MTAGWVTYAVVCLGLAMATTPAAAAGWFLVFGLVAALTESPERAFVANFGARAGTGRRFGVYHAAVGVAALGGGLMFGALYAARGGHPALLVSGALALVLGVMGFGMTARTAH